MKEQKIIVSRSDESLVKDTREKEESNLLSPEEMQEVHYEMYMMQNHTVEGVEDLLDATQHTVNQIGRILWELLLIIITVGLVIFAMYRVNDRVKTIEEQQEVLSEKIDKAQDNIIERLLESATNRKEPREIPKEPDPIEVPLTEEPIVESLDETLVRDFAALVYLEAGSCSRECQMAIASVILNRMTTRNSTFYEIAYAPNQFTPASRIKDTTPSELSLECARYVLENGPTIPEYVCFFRNCFYFDWVEPYMNVDNVYFSYDSRVKESLCRG